MNKNLLNKLNVLIRPDWWCRNYKTNKDWDKALTTILDNPNLVVNKVDEFTIDINGIAVWIANYPYAYGHHYGGRGLRGFGKGIPSRTTAMRLRKLEEGFRKTQPSQPTHNMFDELLRSNGIIP